MVVGLDPTGGSAGRGGRSLANRPATLEGAVGGVLANGLGRGERFLDFRGGEPGAKGPLAGSVKVRKSSVSVPPEPEDWERLTGEATVALTGFGG